jgi:hypothetical protein
VPSRFRRLPVVLLALALVAALGAAPAFAAKILKDGMRYWNPNGAKIILTYAWSGHYAGQGEVCLKPETVTVPTDTGVHLVPPPGFVATDFVVLSQILRGQDTGGFTIYDPPSLTHQARIDLPCPAPGEKVWGFAYFGERDLGPIFANHPMAMDGLDASGLPKVVASQLDENGDPRLNLDDEGHCMVASSAAVLLGDPVEAKVAPVYALRPQAKSGPRVCAQLLLSAGPEERQTEQPAPAQR